jgi:hypothetical protein
MEYIPPVPSILSANQLAGFGLGNLEPRHQQLASKYLSRQLSDIATGIRKSHELILGELQDIQEGNDGIANGVKQLYLASMQQNKLLGAISASLDGILEALKSPTETQSYELSRSGYMALEAGWLVEAAEDFEKSLQVY